MRKLIITFRMAFRDARTNIMHTLLSVLGIVIGVAALVTILSLIDGMERYAHDQITNTTSLEGIMINPKTTDVVDGISIKRKNNAFLDLAAFYELKKEIGDDGEAYMMYRESGWIDETDSANRKGALFSAIENPPADQVKLLAGTMFSKEEEFTKDSVVLINSALATHLANGKSFESLINQYVNYQNGRYKIIGVQESDKEYLGIFSSFSLIPASKLKVKPPFCMIKAKSVESVPVLKEKVQSWINAKYQDRSGDFKLATNEERVKQANQGFLMFRIVMGLIVGISVLVGGIGVMNVLLISVTERTSEIGVRKAVGANKKDIIQQFLAESITISAIGSILGVLLGIGFTLIAVPIVKSVTKMPFEAAYTLNTMLIIGVVAIVVGVVFGTYPAMKAAKLDPVEAIRRE